jgi:ATP-dependent Lhr-like helicase
MTTAVAEVLDQMRPRPRDPDELHDLLLSLVLCRPVPAWQEWFDHLRGDGRADLLAGAWVATERRGTAEVVNRSMADPLVAGDEALAECVGGHLDVSGPVTVEQLIGDAPLPTGSLRGAPVTAARARTGLARLEAAGSAIELPDGRWCARHALVRLHAASRGRRRRYVDPASVADFVRFLACWQHVAVGSQVEGRAGLLSVIEQLQGLEVAAGAWERHILPARVSGYDPRWLDELCLAGEVAWGRLTPRPEPSPSTDGMAVPSVGTGEPTVPAAVRRGSSTPSPATPLAIVTRQDLPWMLAAVRIDNGPTEPTAGASADILATLRRQGACFRSELASGSRRLDTEVDEGLWDLVARGIVTADAFSAVRSLLSTRRRPGARRGAARRASLGQQRARVGSGIGEGRWSTLPEPDMAITDSPAGPPIEELAEAVAWQLLARWGVVAWELWSRESFRVPWREVVRALRRIEARGQALGGRFVAGMAGEQYALPEAASLLSDVHRDAGKAAEVEVAGADPLNLTGALLGGDRIPAVRHRTVRYRHGVLAQSPVPAGAADPR